jgi:hypothetical protein
LEQDFFFFFISQDTNCSRELGTKTAQVWRELGEHLERSVEVIDGLEK